MIRACTVIALSLVVTPLPVAAVELAMTSGTRLVSNRTSPLDSYRLPTGSFADDMVPNQLWEGRVERQSWRIDSSAITTLQLLDRIPEMRVCADLSHYVVDREFWFPLSEHDLELISRILQRSDSFQGRVASRQQIQLPLHFPQHQKWVELFKGWWRDGLADWRKRNPTGDCIFVCELGPPEYAMTDADGREMSNRWEEAQVIKSWVREIWNDLDGDG